VNIDPMLTILEAARHADTRVVLASSAAIYGQPAYLPIDETHPKEPTSPYGLEKLTADHYCRLYHELYDVETVALRYFNAYGPRQQGGDYSGVISIFRDQALADDDITVEGDGEQTRDFVHVDDIVQANILAATNDDAVGEAFNVGTGNSISIRELAEIVHDVTDSNSDIVHVDTREGDIDRSEAAIDKAQDVFGYEPKYSVAEGLEQYLG
jgi:UDP-glucose 4-epimerase